MKKILALCLSLCLLLSCFPLIAGAAEEETLTLKDRVESLLNPEPITANQPSLHVVDGLLYNFVADITEPLALGNGKTLEVDPLFNVSSYQADASLRELDYDYTVTARLSFGATLTEGTVAQFGPLVLALKNKGTPTFDFSFDPNYPSITANLPSSDVNNPLNLTVIAKMDPNYVGDGALESCNHTFTLIDINGTTADITDYFASTSQLNKQSLVMGETPVNVHSLQIYDRALSELDRRQNVFADVVYAHGLSALHPSYLTESAREAYIAPLFAAGDPYTLTKDQVAGCLALGASAIADLEDIYDYSAFMLGYEAEEAWAEPYDELLETAGLDDWSLESFFTLTEEHLEVFPDYYYSLDEVTEESVNEMVLAILADLSAPTNPYEEAMASVLTFDGYQARLEETIAIRARFSANHAAVHALEEQGFTVSYGTTLQYENGETVRINTVYGENADLAPVFTSEETDLFAEVVEAETNSYEECTRAYIFGAFVSIEKDDSAYTILVSCENELFGATASIQSVCAYFLDHGYENAPSIIAGATPLAPVTEANTTAYIPKEEDVA